KRLPILQRRNPEVVGILRMCDFAVVDHPTVSLQCCQSRSSHECALTPVLSRPAERVRLERIVRPLVPHVTISTAPQGRREFHLPRLSQYCKGYPPAQH